MLPTRPKTLLIAAVAAVAALYAMAGERSLRGGEHPPRVHAAEAAASEEQPDELPEMPETANVSAAPRRLAPASARPRPAPQDADAVVDDALTGGVFDQGHADRLQQAMGSLGPAQRRAVGERIEAAIARGELEFDPEPLPR
jgi:hypothetical protein